MTARKARLVAAVGLRILAAVPIVPIASATSAVAACASCHGEPASETLPGVRLGMAPRDVRDRFDGGGDGAWQTVVGSGPRGSGGGGGPGASDDTVVEWTASNDRSRVSHARFEFHLGMLVGVRAHLRENGIKNGARTEATPKTVTVLAPAAGGGTDVTMLARDCPTHHDEAESLAARAR